LAYIDDPNSRLYSAWQDLTPSTLRGPTKQFRVPFILTTSIAPVSAAEPAETDPL